MKIDKNLPIPLQKHRPKKYNLAALAVGDSFHVCEHVGALRSAVSTYMKANPGVKFTSRKVSDEPWGDPGVADRMNPEQTKQTAALADLGLKWCPQCTAFKRLDDFANCTKALTGKQSYCRKCMSALGKLRKVKVKVKVDEVCPITLPPDPPPKPEPPSEPTDPTDPSKKCRRCKTVKSTTEFNKNRNNSDGMNHDCNTCLQHRNETDKLRKAAKRAEQQQQAEQQEVEQPVEQPVEQQPEVDLELLLKQALLAVQATKGAQ